MKLKFALILTGAGVAAAAPEEVTFDPPVELPVEG